MKKTKQYAVPYTFTGAGTVFVEGVNMKEAAEKAKEKLAGMIPKLRPYVVSVHGSSTKILPEGHAEVEDRKHGTW